MCVCVGGGGEGNHKIRLNVGVNYMQFRVFSYSQCTELEYF